MLPTNTIICRTLLLILLVHTSGCRSGDDGTGSQLVGRAVPSLDIIPLERVGPTPTLEGRLTLLNFWGTWCPPCRRELPGLVRLASRLDAEPRFQLIAISCGGGARDDLDQLREETTAFLASAGLTLEAWADPTGRTRQAFASQLGFSAYPTSYLIGPDATVLAVWQGYSTTVEAEIARSVAAALKQLPAPAETGSSATE